MDPTIPRHGRRGRPYCRVGKFVDYGGGKVKLVDNEGDDYDLEFVSFVQGLGSGIEGVTKLPRPWKYKDSDGSVEIEGDLVFLEFLGGNEKLPVVVGCVRRIDPHELVPYNYASEKGDPNRTVLRFQPLDSSGQPAGEVRVIVADDGKGSVLVQATQGVKVQFGADLDGDEFTTVEVVDGKVHVDKGGTRQPVLLSSPFLGDMDGVLTDLLTVATAAGVAPATLTGVSSMQGKIASGDYPADVLESE